MYFALHIYGNTDNQCIKRMLARGDNPNDVMDYLEESPGHILINYVTHNNRRTFAERVELLARIDSM